MNSSSHAGSTISCPRSPPLQRLLPFLHSTTFTLPIFTSQEQSTLQKKRRLQKKTKTQTAAEEITQHLVLFDIYKTPSERHDVHRCECTRAGVIRTRAACVLSLCCCTAKVSRTSALMSTWRGTACVSWLV